MEEEQQEQLLQEPINFTDPYVLHDPAINFPHIAQLYMPNDMRSDEDEELIGNNLEYDSLKANGLMYPIVQINTRVIDYTQIVKLVINYDELLPSIYIKIKDYNRETQIMDMPGLNNSIKVIIIPEVNYRYKSIALEFNITNCDINGIYVTYSGVYKLLAFNKEYTKEIIYDGCSNNKQKTSGNNSDETSSNVSCNPNQNKQPNTWELLHSIALSCELGFCSTDNCQNINDNLPRIMSNQRYPEYIRQQMSWCGTDENNIMDCWVDLYGYLVLVNVSWLLTCDVQPDNLGIDAIVGVHTTDSINVPKQDYTLVHRTLSNFERTECPNNLAISFYRTIINNNDLLSGTSVSAFNFNLLDVGGSNSISQYDVEVIQNSLDGQKYEEYASQRLRNFIIECNDRPINGQKIIRDKFFSKHRQRILEVRLQSLNLGLQRGTLVNVIIVETGKIAKKLITSSTSNFYGYVEDIEEDELPVEDISTKELIEREDIPLPNMALSGMYYIDGMRFEYSYKSNSIYQYLYLIKRGSTSNLNNFSTAPRLNDLTDNAV